MVSKADMIKVIPKDKLMVALKRKKKPAAKTWNKDKLAAGLPLDEIRKLYMAAKPKPAAVKKKVVKKVGCAKKKVARPKKAPVKRTVKRKAIAVKKKVAAKKPARKAPAAKKGIRHKIKRVIRRK